MNRRPGVDVALLIQVAAAAFVGGALAMIALVALRDIDHRGLVGTLVVVVAVLSVLAAAMFLPETEEPSAGGPAREERRGWASAQTTTTPAPAPPPSTADRPAPWWARTGTSASARADGNGTPPAAAGKQSTTWWDTQAAVKPEAAPVNLAVPVPGGSWWKAASADARTPGLLEAAAARDASGAPLPDLADYGAATRLVQCPRCGDFGVDVRHQPPGFAFVCKRCDHHWRWVPGSAWPATVVRPRRQRRQRSDGDSL